MRLAIALAIGFWPGIASADCADQAQAYITTLAAYGAGEVADDAAQDLRACLRDHHPTDAELISGIFGEQGQGQIGSMTYSLCNDGTDVSLSIAELQTLCRSALPNQ
jgi:hypothetical protein